METREYIYIFLCVCVRHWQADLAIIESDGSDFTIYVLGKYIIIIIIIMLHLLWKNNGTFQQCIHKKDYYFFFFTNELIEEHNI